MRQVLIWAIMAGFFLTYSSKAEAFLFGKKKDQPAESSDQAQAAAAGQPAAKAAQVKQETPKKTEKQAEAIEAKKKLSDKKRSDLNNTEWPIDLTGITGKEKKETDTVVFKNGQVMLTGYSKKGFPATNFTLTLQDDGSAVWETMQTSEKSGVAFWRGEIDPQMQGMRGVLSLRVDDKTSHDYSFVSTGKKDIVPEPQTK